jgi:hypothetical protein
VQRGEVADPFVVVHLGKMSKSTPGAGRLRSPSHPAVRATTGCFVNNYIRFVSIDQSEVHFVSSSSTRRSSAKYTSPSCCSCVGPVSCTWWCLDGEGVAREDGARPPCAVPDGGPPATRGPPGCSARSTLRRRAGLPAAAPPVVQEVMVGAAHGAPGDGATSI